ncbi:hypothetical protein [Edaphobacter dinghuensis]|uniref:Response regulator receiver domain-containing protein n=1 Tax=Edaphobacter dinghuensis TaxID=1560005 RepID=A0A917M3F9_9BACT|nr:hypothetical protein [Edaphobacter dinghuensis]GGG74931.1 hypothetical protein GCM10011585_17100 [Edaphobacter dinghuensis]
MRNGIPDTILSDLNMPSMSGFELLTVVSLLFPAIQRIAMYGYFLGEDVPVGIVVDLFLFKRELILPLWYT